MRSLPVILCAVLLLAACGRGPQPAGSVTYGTLTIEQGNVPSSVMNDKLAALHSVIEGCYARALSKNPRASGTIDLKISGAKPVSAEVTRNTVGDASLTQCATQTVHSVQVPDSLGSFVALWSVNFNPKG